MPLSTDPPLILYSATDTRIDSLALTGPPQFLQSSTGVPEFPELFLGPPEFPKGPVTITSYKYGINANRRSNEVSNDDPKAIFCPADQTQTGDWKVEVPVISEYTAYLRCRGTLTGRKDGLVWAFPRAKPDDDGQATNWYIIKPQNGPDGLYIIQTTEAERVWTAPDGNDKQLETSEMGLQGWQKVL